MYHSVRSGSVTAAFRRYQIDPGELSEQLSILRTMGYETAFVSELVDQPLGGRRVAVTFDDAFCDFRDVVLPILEQYAMKATLYVPTAFVGGHAAWLAPEGEGHRRILSWGDLAEVVASGRVEIGSHSCSHAELDRLGAADLRAELERPKCELEDRLAMEVGAFAYPFGYHSRRTRSAVAAAGYTSACVVGELPARLGGDVLKLSRVSVAPETTAIAFTSLLTRRATRARRIRSAVLARGWRTYRRTGLWGRPARIDEDV